MKDLSFCANNRKCCNSRMLVKKDLDSQKTYCISSKTQFSKKINI